MENDPVCEMEDFVTVDEVGNFAEEPVQPPEETAVTSDGHSTTSSLLPDNTEAGSEDTRVTRVEKKMESRTRGAGVDGNVTDENGDEDTQQVFPFGFGKANSRLCCLF